MGIALDKINKLKVKKYNWLESPYAVEGTPDIGLIAEELAEVIPEAVWWKNGQIEGIKPLTMIGVLIKAIQELQGEKL
jgi:hypothetical protein